MTPPRDGVLTLDLGLGDEPATRTRRAGWSHAQLLARGWNSASVARWLARPDWFDVGADGPPGEPMYARDRVREVEHGGDWQPGCTPDTPVEAIGRATLRDRGWTTRSIELWLGDPDVDTADGRPGYRATTVRAAERHHVWREQHGADTATAPDAGRGWDRRDAPTVPMVRAARQFRATRPRTPDGRRARTLERARELVDDGRRAGTDGRGQVAAGLALLVARPGASGRRYAADGTNSLAGHLTPEEIPLAATTAPLTVTPSYAFTIVDVDYDRADDNDARRRLKTQVDDLVVVLRDAGIEAARVASGGRSGTWANEHVWIATGSWTMTAANRRVLAELLRRTWPGLALVGGSVDGGHAAQQVRPPGSRHRRTGWPPLADLNGLVAVLLARSPAEHDMDHLVDVLRGRARDTTLTGRLERAAAAGTVPRELPARTPDAWALEQLDHGPAVGTDRSIEACRLVGHLLSRGWDVARICDTLADSPAVDYLRDRQGAVSLDARIAGDVARIARKYRAAARDRCHDVALASIAVNWDLVELASGERHRWLLQSGRLFLGALASEVLRTGHRTVLRQQRSLAVLADVSLATAHRSLHRWIDVGVLQPHLDDRGQLTAVTVDVERLHELLELPDSALLATAIPPTETSTVHTPAQPGSLRECWIQRPSGASTFGITRLGRRCQLAHRRLQRQPMTAEELAESLLVSARYAKRLLRRLQTHALVSLDGSSTWATTNWDEGATRATHELATHGVLGTRRQRYDTEITAWRATRELLGIDAAVLSSTTIRSEA